MNPGSGLCKDARGDGDRNGFSEVDLRARVRVYWPAQVIYEGRILWMIPYDWREKVVRNMWLRGRKRCVMKELEL